MRLFWVFAVVLLVSGCSAGSGDIVSLNNMVPVYYPAANTTQEPLVEAYGPTFRSVARDYPEYQFN